MAKKAKKSEPGREKISNYVTSMTDKRKISLAKKQYKKPLLPGESVRDKNNAKVSEVAGLRRAQRMITRERRSRANTLKVATAIDDGTLKSTETLKVLSDKYLSSIEQQKELSRVISKCGKMIDTLVELL